VDVVRSRGADRCVHGCKRVHVFGQGVFARLEDTARRRHHGVTACSAGRGTGSCHVRVDREGKRLRRRAHRSRPLGTLARNGDGERRLRDLRHRLDRGDRRAARRPLRRRLHRNAACAAADRRGRRAGLARPSRPAAADRVRLGRAALARQQPVRPSGLLLRRTGPARRARGRTADLGERHRSCELARGLRPGPGSGQPRRHLGVGRRRRQSGGHGALHRRRQRRARR
jgi:hypothetical protein